MSKELWTAVDQYTTDLLLPADAALDGSLAAGAPIPPPSEVDLRRREPGA